MPHCRDCADSDGFCCNDQWGRNCGFKEGHHMHRTAQFRTCPGCRADGRSNEPHDYGCPYDQRS
jgi:hypothetical protein